jgi:1-acyl-sn-glycerol-3-phosphate acyltransferase
MSTRTTPPRQATCVATTRRGIRCTRPARPGSDRCAQHARASSDTSAATSRASVTPTDAPSVPADIDTAELREVVRDLTADRGRFGAGAGEVTATALDDLAAVVTWLGDNVVRVRDALVNNGLVDPRRFEQFLAEAAAALTSAAGAVTTRLRGDYEEDDFGYDREFTEAIMPLVALLHDYWWRVDTIGMDNVPADGRGLLVSNHAGSGLPFDGVMIKTALLRDHPGHRHLRLLVLDWLMGLPWLADLMKQTGQVLACTPNATELLLQDELVAVFPEGIKGMAKPFSQRYNLQRFGRGGFVRVALKTGAPIIPVAVVGSEEIYPKIGNIPMVNKLIGAPFVPMTPLFPFLGIAGLIPLPSKWIIEFCDPIDVSQYPPEAADDRSFILELSEQIRATIQERLRANLAKRSTPFW